VALGGFEQYLAWLSRESPGVDARRAVDAFLTEAADEPWRAPSTPIPELSSQPDFEVRTVELALPPGGVVQVWYRHTYATQTVEVLDITGD
jgi:hypothetical protein